VFTTVIHTSLMQSREFDAITSVIPGEMQRCAGHHRLHHHQPVARDALPALRRQLLFDINPLPETFHLRPVQLVISDMDSTLITIECIDEIAYFAGLRPQVAAITAQAMRGELDFASSLLERVALLKGLDVTLFDAVYRDRLNLSPGVREMLAGLKQRTIPFALVSGGFAQFTGRLQRELGLAYSRGITLELEGTTLTGRVAGEIIDAEGKAAYLRQLCRELSIECSQTIAIGDGANDLKMLQQAGLGIAYRAKPVVQAAADAVLNYSGLEAVLDFIG
jgi:phosphoserine phosphatase